MSTTRTVRTGAWLSVGLLLAGACGDDDDTAPEPAPTTGAPTPGTLPDDVEPGRGALVLDGELAVLTVTNCTLAPATDATGVTTVLTAAASDGTRLVDVVRSSFTAEIATVTDTVTITSADGAAVESSRADVDGRQVDLRDPNPAGPLLDVDLETGRIAARGVFGPLNGGPDDPANVDGELLLRCP